jgi:hypothetical protein
MEKKYVGELGTEAYDGYAGLTLGTTYTGEEQLVPVPSKEEGAEPILVKRIVIALPTGRTTSVTAEQWMKWFE